MVPVSKVLLSEAIRECVWDDNETSINNRLHTLGISYLPPLPTIAPFDHSFLPTLRLGVATQQAQHRILAGMSRKTETALILAGV